MDGKQWAEENFHRMTSNRRGGWKEDIAEAFDAGKKDADSGWALPLQDRIEKLAGELAVGAETRVEPGLSRDDGNSITVAIANKLRVSYFVSMAAAIIAEAERVSKFKGGQ